MYIKLKFNNNFACFDEILTDARHCSLYHVYTANNSCNSSQDNFHFGRNSMIYFHICNIWHLPNMDRFELFSRISD